LLAVVVVEEAQDVGSLIVETGVGLQGHLVR
jgi:hypothetical protein